MPNKKIFAILALLLAFLILTSGCLQQKLAPEQREQCLQLASHSKTSIPKCETQEACFQQVNAGLFNFPDAQFSASTSQKLNLYKNYLARAWLFHNRAIANIKRIYQLCASDSDLALLPRNVNELNSNLNEEFRSAEFANTASFEILLLEAADLERQEIRKIKEEELYTFYILLNNNLNELKNPEAIQSSANEKFPESYVKFYFSRLNAFNRLADAYGFSKITTKESNIWDFISYYDGPLLKEAAKNEKNKFYIPLITDAISGIINYITMRSKVDPSLNALLKFPAFEVLNFFNDFSGAENSVAKEFAELMRKDYWARDSLSQRSASLKQEIQKLLASSNSRIADIDSEAYSPFDSNFLSGLYALLGQKSEIATQTQSISDIALFKEASSGKLYELSQKFNSLLELEALGKASSGESVSGLKGILGGIKHLNSGLDYFSSEVLQGLEVLCDSRINAIREGLNIDIESSKLSDLRARLAYNIAGYLDSNSQRQKLIACKPVIEMYNSYAGAKTDFAEFEEANENGLRNCAGYLQRLFSEGAEELKDFQPRFFKLQALLPESENPEQLLQACTQLKQDAYAYLSNNPEIQEISGKFSETGRIIEAIKGANSNYAGFVSDSEMGKINSKFSSFRKFFPENEIDLPAVMPLAPELNANLEEFSAELRSLLKDAISKYLRNSYAKELIAGEVPLLDSLYASQLRISFENPLNEALYDEIKFEIPLEGLSGLRLAYAAPNIISAEYSQGKISFALSSLPPGKTLALFDVNAVAASSEQEDKLLFVDVGKAAVRRTITIKANADLPVLKISSPAGNYPISDAFVYSDSRQIESAVNGNSIEFILQNARDRQQIEIYFSIANPVDANVGLLNSEKIDENATAYDFLISMKNNLEIPILKTRVAVPIAISAGEIRNGELFDSSGKEIGFEIIDAGKISFVVPELYPQQSMQFYFSYEVRNYLDYWQRVIDGLQSRLSSLASSESGEIAGYSASLAEELSEIGSTSDFTESRHINSISAIAKEAEKLLEREQTLLQQSSQYAQLSSQVSDEVNEAEGEIAKLTSFGYAEQAGALNSNVQKARQYAEDAQTSKSIPDYDSALGALFRAKALLNERSSKNLAMLLSNDKSALMQKANSAIERMLRFKIRDYNSLQLKEAALDLSSRIESSIMGGNYADAKSALDALAEKTDEYENAIKSQLMQKTESISEKISRFSSLLSETGLKARASRLAENFNEITQGIINRLDYIPPITRERIEKILLEITRLDSLKLGASLNEFIKKSTSQGFEEALSGYEGISPEFETRLQEAEAISAELENAERRLREDAIANYTKTNSKLNSAMLADSRIPELMKSSKSEIAKSNYLKSIALSGSAMLLLSLQDGQQQIPLLPLAALPLFALIGFIFYMRHRGRGAKQQIRFQKVLKND
ncbi:MAG: hypothetical protein HYW05_04435 [Candidatus Diapherotrites archaeon]|nr:hypothetical protein [Candidatus Diapherotrites archaeon]